MFTYFGHVCRTNIKTYPYSLLRGHCDGNGPHKNSWTISKELDNLLKTEHSGDTILPARRLCSCRQVITSSHLCHNNLFAKCYEISAL